MSHLIAKFIPNFIAIYLIFWHVNSFKDFLCNSDDRFGFGSIWATVKSANQETFHICTINCITGISEYLGIFLVIDFEFLFCLCSLCFFWTNLINGWIVKLTMMMFFYMQFILFDFFFCEFFIFRPEWNKYLSSYDFLSAKQIVSAFTT